MPRLTETQKQALLGIARASLISHLAGDESILETPEPMADASGVFVTIKRHGELRGCLGTLHLRGPLPAEVARCAQDSATKDPRFPPMTSADLPGTRIEVSVLGPLDALDPVDQTAIEIGQHGLVVEQGPRRGLLLPQVATEFGWDAEQFLQQTSSKAGLPPDAWCHGARVFRFTADVFGEPGEAGRMSEERLTDE